MISATTGKEVIADRSLNLIDERDYGAIEAVPHAEGVGASYNVLRQKTSNGRRPFYKSAYSLEKAKKHLKELEL